MTEAILSADGLVKRYGGLTAVDQVSFKVEAGSITGLIGPNGAGKTTLFDLISGFQRPDAGSVSIRDKELKSVMQPDAEERFIGTLSSGITVAVLGAGGASIAGLSVPLIGASLLGGAGVGAAAHRGTHRVIEGVKPPRPRPHQVARSGLVRTFQITRELNGMSVLDNLLLAPQGQSGEDFFRALFRRGTVASQEEAIRERAMEILELLELTQVAEDYAANLSGGQRKLLELGRVLMADPEIILLDEPVAGVNPTLTNKLVERIEALRSEGYTFFVIEHDMDVIMDLSDRILVMNNGKLIMEGTPAEVRSSDAVVDAYLGE